MARMNGSKRMRGVVRDPTHQWVKIPSSNGGKFLHRNERSYFYNEKRRWHSFAPVSAMLIDIDGNVLWCVYTSIPTYILDLTWGCSVKALKQYVTPASKQDSHLVLWKGHYISRKKVFWVEATATSAVISLWVISCDIDKSEVKSTSIKPCDDDSLMSITLN